MVRRISTKLVVAVLATVVLPFVAFAFFINDQMGDRLSRHVVRQTLLGLAKDVAGQVDAFVQERRQDLVLLAGEPLVTAVLEQPRAPARIGAVVRELDRFVDLKEVYDLVLVVDVEGRVVASSSRDATGAALDPTLLESLRHASFADEPWFQGALAGRATSLDHHESPFRIREVGPAEDLVHNYQVAFAAPARRDPLQGGGAVNGVVFALVNWSHVQQLVSAPVVTDAFRGLVSPGVEPSPYAWLWAADAETILGHVDRTLYYQSVVTDIGLPELTAAARKSATGWGLFPEYTFRGVEKNAAFRRCRGAESGGFGWVVGVGINDEDIYAIPGEMQRLLLGGTAVILLVAIGWTLVIARRTTRPILELQRHTRRVAGGDLDVDIAVHSRDELGDLARDFNVMTHELVRQREAIVKAEKDAAWREMARQIAHDIKNPLTPIKLSLDLLERARREKAPGSEAILERTMDLIGRQVENLREIAGDFYEFTGGRKPVLEPVGARALLEEVLQLHDAWATERGVDVRLEGPEAEVLADRGKLRRVFVNLVSNALQAMPEGGALRASVTPEARHVCVEIRDTGVGLSPEVRAHLFEPYFTTRSEGTGLGLAIAKRVLEEMGATIELEPVEPVEEGDPSVGGGTCARVCLPHAGASAPDASNASGASGPNGAEGPSGTSSSGGTNGNP